MVAQAERTTGWDPRWKARTPRAVRPPGNARWRRGDDGTGRRHRAGSGWHAAGNVGALRGPRACIVPPRAGRSVTAGLPHKVSLHASHHCTRRGRARGFPNRGAALCSNQEHDGTRRHPVRDECCGGRTTTWSRCALTRGRSTPFRPTPCPTPRVPRTTETQAQMAPNGNLQSCANRPCPFPHQRHDLCHRHGPDRKAGNPASPARRTRAKNGA